MRTTKKKLIHQCQCHTCKNAPRSTEAKEHQAINQVLRLLHEKGRRQFVGLLALQWGRGGLERLHVITGLSHPTIRKGRKEVQRKDGKRNEIECGNKALDVNGSKKTAWDHRGIERIAER